MVALDLNLDTLKREILEYLEASGFAVFRGHAGGLDGLPLVCWDSESYPDYQMFLETAKRVGAKMIVFAAREFDMSEVEEAVEQLEETELTREERRDYERRLSELRVFEGVTCSIELAFDHDARLYVYELQPDWYQDFLGTCDEIVAHLPDADQEDDDGLGGYFSKN